MSTTNKKKLKKNKFRKKVEMQPGYFFHLRPFVPSYIIYLSFFCYLFYIIWKYYFVHFPIAPSFMLNAFFAVSGPHVIKISNILKACLNVIIYSFYTFFVFLGFVGFGRFLRKKIVKISISQLTNLCADFALGCLCFIVFIFVLSFGKMVLKFPIIIFLLFGAIYAAVDFLFFYKNKKLLTKDTPINRDKAFFTKNMYYLAYISFAVLIFIVIVSSTVPETFYDSLAYHLGLPQKWIQNKAVYYDSFSNMASTPLNLEIIYMAGMIIKDTILAKYMHFMFGIILTILIFDIGKTYFNKYIGLLSAFIFAVTTNAVFIASKTAVELGAGLFDLLALTFLILWYTNEHGSVKRKAIILAGVFQGMALGTKYTALFTTIALFLTIGILFFREQRIRKNYKDIFFFILAIVLVAGPWYIRNWIITGNPVFPLYSNIFGFVKMRMWGNMKNDPTPVPFTISNLLFFPWKLAFGIVAQESFTGIIYLLFIPWIFILKKVKENKCLKICSIYIVVYLLLWMKLGNMYVRFFISGLPVIALIFTSKFFLSNINDTFKKIIVFCVFFAGFTNLLFLFSLQGNNLKPIECFLGLTSQAKYLSIQRASYPNPYYQAVEWFNKNLAPNEKILLLGETRCTYFKNECVLADVSMDHPIIKFIRLSENEDELMNLLKKENITYIFLNVPEARRLVRWDMFFWKGEELIIFDKFIKKYTKEAYKFCPDVRLNNNSFLSDMTESWIKYKKSSLNYMYIYKILYNNEKKDRISFNYLILPMLYSENRWNKIIDNPVFVEYLNKNYPDLVNQGVINIEEKR